jgi:transposase
MAKYSEDFKKSIVKKILRPDGPGVTEVSEDSGISIQTLYSWLRKLREDVEMSLEGTNPEDRSILEKQELILDAASIPESELGAWLREKGIHEEQLKLWKTEVREALRYNKKEERKEISASKKKIKELEKEIQKKDKALAEMTTLMALKKKLEGIWFEKEEDQ